MADRNEKWTGQTASSDPTALPQAQPDRYNESTGFLVTTEDATGSNVYAINVGDLLANDKGGSAKTLYSVNDFSTGNAAVSISADGTKILYDANGKFDHLAEGQSAEDTITYTIRLANGATSTTTAKLKIEGADEAVQLRHASMQTDPALGLTHFDFETDSVVAPSNDADMAFRFYDLDTLGRVSRGSYYTTSSFLDGFDISNADDINVSSLSFDTSVYFADYGDTAVFRTAAGNYYAAGHFQLDEETKMMGFDYVPLGGF